MIGSPDFKRFGLAWFGGGSAVCGSSLLVATSLQLVTVPGSDSISTQLNHLLQAPPHAQF